MSGLKKNDKVLTTSGIYGTVISVAEKEDEVVVKVDDNTRLKMVKAAILRNITNEEDAVKAKQTAKDERRREAMRLRLASVTPDGTLGLSRRPQRSRLAASFCERLTPQARG